VNDGVAVVLFPVLAGMALSGEDAGLAPAGPIFTQARLAGLWLRTR
jgi:hypothetical protein